MKNVQEFNDGLISLVAGKKAADMIAQNLAIYSINQSIEHSNADCGIRLIRTMQESKYGNVKAMVKYLCAVGCFAVDEKTNKMVFKKKELVLQTEKDDALWLKFAKEEKIEYPKDDAWVTAQIAALLKTTRAWSKNHPDKAATPQTINALAALIPAQQVAVVPAV